MLLYWHLLRPGMLKNFSPAESATIMDVLRIRPANEVLNLIRRMQRPGGFDDDDFDARSMASVNSLGSTVDGLGSEEYHTSGR